MDARSELFVYLGSTIVTVVALFAFQLTWESYLDVSVVHGQQRDAQMDEQLAKVRAEEQQKLSSGRIPIDQAMSQLADGRSKFPKLAPKASEDLSAMSGWIHRPGFAPYEPRKPAAPPAAAEGAEGAATEEGAGAAEGAAAPAEGAAPAEAAPADGAAPVQGATAQGKGAAAPAAAKVGQPAAH